jgi:predicted PurR-regulated permease PerM
MKYFALILLLLGGCITIQHRLSPTIENSVVSNLNRVVESVERTESNLNKNVTDLAANIQRNLNEITLDIKDTTFEARLALQIASANVTLVTTNIINNANETHEQVSDILKNIGLIIGLIFMFLRKNILDLGRMLLNFGKKKIKKYRKAKK